MAESQKPKALAYRTPVGRVSFPWLTVAQPPLEEGGKASYQVTLLIPKNEDITELRDMIEQVIKAKWPRRPANLRNPIRDGAEKPDLAGYGPDVWFINAKTQSKPPCVDAGKAPVDPEAVYAGCYARLSVTPFAYEKSVNKGVGLSLNAVQFIRDGEPFSSRIDVDDAFDDESEATAGSSW